MAITDVCPTLSLLMVTVASATLRATGVQSSLLEELIKLSMAPFSTSMPEADVKERNRKQMAININISVDPRKSNCWSLCVSLTYWSDHRQHPKVEDLKLLNQLCLRCGELCWVETTHTLHRSS